LNLTRPRAFFFFSKGFKNEAAFVVGVGHEMEGDWWGGECAGAGELSLELGNGGGTIAASATELERHDKQAARTTEHWEEELQDGGQLGWVDIRVTGQYVESSGGGTTKKLFDPRDCKVVCSMLNVPHGGHRENRRRQMSWIHCNDEPTVLHS
jgi:hypothetical protein